MAETRINNHAAFIWSVADLLRGDYKRSEYGKVILPLTVLRRLDCVLEPTKPAVLARAAKLRFEVTPETADRVAATKHWAKLTSDQQHDLSARCSELAGVSTTERSVMATKLGPIPKAVEKQVWDALAVEDPEAPIVTNRKGDPEPDPDLRDNENVPLPAIAATWVVDPTERLASVEYRSAVEDYMAEEVLPYVPDAWVDHAKTKIGYEIPLTRHFYKYVPPRPLAEIDAEIKALEEAIQELLREVTE